MNTAFRRYLRLDSPLLRGNDVLALQTALGLPEAQRDGIFGQGTRRALVEFQRRNRLLADGIAGPATWTRLFGADSAQAAGQPASGVEPYLPELMEFHRRYGDSILWRLTANGIDIEGRGVETTSGRPETVRRVCRDYRLALENAARSTGAPVELLIATLCTEAYDAALHTVNPRATRKEPGYLSDAATPHRVSHGLTQTLLSTARQAMSQLRGGAAIPEHLIDREWLYQPANAILAGAAYIAAQSGRTRYDPPVVACAYNAGSVIHNGGARNRWKMRQFPIGADAHADRFVHWFNDCFRLFRETGCPFDASTTFWHRLNGGAGAAPGSAEPIASGAEPHLGPISPPPAPHPAVAADFVFPQRKRPALDYKSGGREFGARRSGGRRKHAGCDLKAPKGTEILAMADGRVIRGPYAFYGGTFALEVRHANGMVVRYGEIDGKAPKGVRAGADVLRGQVIACVGRLDSGNSMLHLELYAGDQSGPLTQPGNPFMRRADLVDPTPYLDQAPLLESLGAELEVPAEAELEDRGKNPEPREPSRWDEALRKAQTTGASKTTAAQDHLEPGVKASRKLAEADLNRVKKLADRFHAAASKFGIPAALLAALASRESRCGAALTQDGMGDRGYAFGILQMDRRYHDLDGFPDPESEAHIEEAAGLIAENLAKIAERHPDWEDEFVLKGAAVAYNAGIRNVRTKDRMDVGSTGDDYGSDVIARAQYYYGHPDLAALFR